MTTTPESVWDYPRPPSVERTSRHAVVEVGGVIIADSRGPLRVLETSHPPVYYFPPEDVKLEFLKRNQMETRCEYKGVALYWDIVLPETSLNVSAWSYPDPTPGYLELKDHIAVYPSKMDRCTLDGEVADPQDGAFYGGWVTSGIAGPFKGGPGTLGW